jgi:hypothetical protein
MGDRYFWINNEVQCVYYAVAAEDILDIVKISSRPLIYHLAPIAYLTVAEERVGREVLHIGQIVYMEGIDDTIAIELVL